MKLLILDQFGEWGGAQQALFDLLPAFRDRGWNTVVGVPGDGGFAARLRSAGVETVRIECGPYECGRKSPGDVLRFLRDTPTLARRIRELAAGVGVVYLNGPRLLPAASLAELPAPALYHAHSLLPRGIAGHAARLALNRLHARVLANSRFVANSWHGATVIYNGVRPHGAPSRRNGRTVACIGRIAPEKGQLHFLAAAAEMRSHIPDCRFVIYGAPLFSGDAYDRDVRMRAIGLPVEFAGWSDDVPRALASTDVLLVPSSPVEATTRVILEAFAAGTPVVAFANGGIPEVIDHGRTGFLARSAQEMARFGVALLRDPGLRAEISANAHESWQRRFTLEQYRRDVVAEVENVLRPPVSRQPLRPAWGSTQSA